MEKIKTIFPSILAVVLLTGVIIMAKAEEQKTFAPEELAERTIHRRAVEAVIWGMPAVNFDRMLQAAIANGGAVNQVVYRLATAYDRQTHVLIRETSRSSLGSNTEGVQKNADGSTYIYFGPNAPAGKESNWVPTNGRDFEVLFRLYGLEKTFFDKTWVLPDIEEVK